MRELINHVVLANMVSMIRAETGGAIWLSDASDDKRFFEQCAHTSARIVDADGVALPVLDEIRRRGIPGVVASVRGAVRDAEAREDVFVPLLGDAISIALLSQSCDRVLNEAAGAEWCRAAAGKGCAVIDRAVEVAAALTNVSRVSNAPDVLAAPDAFIDWERFEVRADDVKRLLAEAEPTAEGLDTWYIVPDTRRAALTIPSGRFVLEILSAATRAYTPHGLRSREIVSADQFMRLLVVAFEREMLEEDDIFWKMRRWEIRNRGYPLLTAWRSLDPLGGLLDQRYWMTDLKRLLGIASSYPIAAFKMDLDNFRSVNSELGHAGGDEAIREYMACVRRVLGGTAESYRRGGDEVVALAPGVGLQQAEILAETLRNEIESRFREWGAAKHLSSFPTASIGVVPVSEPVDADTVEQLMESAQWQAKERGKNVVVVLSAMASE